jgi:thiol:disulfide interchange protein
MNREEFGTLLENNQGVLVVKFTAAWCKPCQTIKAQVDKETANLPDHVKFIELDIDVHFDVYANMRSKKQVVGIPAILAYKKGNTTWFADHSISGTNPVAISQFFQTVRV